MEKAMTLPAEILADLEVATNKMIADTRVELAEVARSEGLSREQVAEVLQRFDNDVAAWRSSQPLEQIHAAATRH